MLLPWAKRQFGKSAVGNGSDRKERNEHLAVSQGYVETAQDCNDQRPGPRRPEAGSGNRRMRPAAFSSRAGCRTGAIRIGLRLDAGDGAVAETGAVRGPLPRVALGGGLCQQDGWRYPRGKLSAASARKALPRLVAQSRLELPKAQPRPPPLWCPAAGGRVRRPCRPTSVLEAGLWAGGGAQFRGITAAAGVA